MSDPSPMDIQLELFCLVDGELLKNAVSVEIDSTANFDDIAADKLTLWLVKIPEDKEGSAIKLGELDEKEELTRPRKTMMTLFPTPPDEQTYIVVQRPLLNAPKIKLAYENIEPELLRIVEEASRNHETHRVKQEDVEEYQRKALGNFYKSPLPYGMTEKSIYLRMLGNMLGKEPMTQDGLTLRNIVENDIDIKEFSVVAIVSRSGSGKTATVIELAKRHFVIYVMCSDPRGEQTFEVTDPNFVQLGKDVENMCSAFTNSGQYRDLKELDTGLKSMAAERIDIEFLARLIFLWILFRKYPQLTPEQFFREQLNGGAKTVQRLVWKLLKYDSKTIDSMLPCVEEYLSKDYLHERGLAIALDEAHVAMRDILAGKLISPQALIDNDFLDHKRRVRNDARRGFLTPLCATLSRRRATLITLGTSLTLRDADHVYNAINKRTRRCKITHFPSFNKQDIQAMLSEVIDISDCEIPEKQQHLLTGRARFSIRVVEQLITGNHHGQESKQKLLENALNKTIQQSKDDLEDSVRKIINKDRSGEIVKLLSRMVIAYKLWNGKISFANDTTVDFIQSSLCSLQEESDGVHFNIDEPLVVKVVETKLKKLGVDITYVQYLDQFNRLIEHLGVKSTAKGDMLEPLIRRSLQRFHGWDLVNLPFLRGIKLPRWCIGRQGCLGDFEFLKERPPNKLLIEQFGTRQDGAWFFDDHYAGSIAIKLYTDPLRVSVHEENETSSDIRKSFLKKDCVNENSSLKHVRKEFKASLEDKKIKGILRIHLEFPSVSGTRPVTRVETDRTTSEEDVMVHIDSENMGEFFYEGIPENVEDIRTLKRLLKYVMKK